MKELVGKNVIIRTITAIYTGTLVSVGKQWLGLANCAWIADTGRWGNALQTGQVEEVEPYPDGVVYVSSGVVLDVSLWTHELPRVVK